MSLRLQYVCEHTANYESLLQRNVSYTKSEDFEIPLKTLGENTQSIIQKPQNVQSPKQPRGNMACTKKEPQKCDTLQDDKKCLKPTI